MYVKTVCPLQYTASQCSASQCNASRYTTRQCIRWAPLLDYVHTLLPMLDPATHNQIHLKIKERKTHHIETHPHCLTRSITAMHCITLHYNATHSITLQHTAAHCSTLQHTAAHCITLQHTVSHCSTLLSLLLDYNMHIDSLALFLQHTATHCITLHHTATHCNPLYHTATHCITLQHTPIPSSILRYTHKVLPGVMCCLCAYTLLPRALPLCTYTISALYVKCYQVSCVAYVYIHCCRECCLYVHPLYLHYTYM